jgi:hypothetical protein
VSNGRHPAPEDETDATDNDDNKQDATKARGASNDAPPEEPRQRPTQTREQRSDKAAEKPRPQPTQDRDTSDKDDETRARQARHTQRRQRERQTRRRLERGDYGNDLPPKKITSLEAELLELTPPVADEWVWEQELRPLYQKLYNRCAFFQIPTFLSPPTPFEHEENSMKHRAERQLHDTKPDKKQTKISFSLITQKPNKN